MKMEKALVVLYVADQQRSRDFYQLVLQRRPRLDVPGMTEFQLTDSLVLGIMPEKGIARILGPSVPHPKEGNGIPRCELYLFLDDPVAAYQRLVEAGGQPLSPPTERDWGDLAGYVLDPDGHVVAVACPAGDAPC